jgi:UDP-glucose 4-epimerase
MFHRLYELNYVCLRYSNVYGPRQDPYGEAGVVAIFTRMMLDHKQPTIFGTGEHERDFVYVDDVVDANMLAMEKPNNRCFNIGTGLGTSVNYLFELLARLIKYRWKPVYGAPRPGDVFKIRLDVSRAAQELGWTPKTTLEQGLMYTVEHFRRSKKRGQQE